jgi:hypothetical protein
MAYTASQLATLWLQAGGSNALARISTGETLPLSVVMAAVALAESSGRADAVNPGYGAGGRRTNEYSVGLWQINTLVHRNYTREQLKDPLTNAREAVRIYGVQGLRAWGSYTDGRYRQFLAAAKSANVGGGFPVTLVSPVPIPNEVAFVMAGIAFFLFIVTRD